LVGQGQFRKNAKISDGQFMGLKVYAELLVKWQNAYNLVGSKTIDKLWTRHIYDSAQLLALVDGALGINKNRIWMDLGAGAGFPGLVISIMGGGKVHLVESNGKKCSFMRAVIRETSADAIVHQSRIEDMVRFDVDIITSRALATVKRLLDYSEPFVSQKLEMWYHKGQDVDEELREATKYWKVNINKYPSQTDEAGTILRLRNPSRVKQRNKLSK